MKKILLSALVFVASTFAAHAIEGELSGRFTINAEGDTVHFSKGNLQYQAMTTQWLFANKQYELDEGVLSYFAFGTSGWNSGANEYQPYSTSTEASDYLVGGSAENGLTGEYANADWGIYNAIQNGGNKAGLWRTLTMDEWWYIFAGRENADKLFSLGTIKWTDSKDNTTYTSQGVIILPDNWVLPQGAKFRAATDDAMIYEESDKMYRNMNLDLPAVYERNIYTLEQWEVMEDAGAVFLPALGYAQGVDVIRAGIAGHYASSTPRHENGACTLQFDGSELCNTWNYRYRGISVRLVTREQTGEGIDQTPSGSPSRGEKVLRDGMLLIERNGKTYTTSGAEVK